MTSLLFKYFGCFTFLFLLCLSCKSDKDEAAGEVLCEKDLIRSPYLISVDDAKIALDNHSHIILLDISKKKSFGKEHIPGALNLWRPDFRSKADEAITGLRCSRVELEALLTEIGVGPSSLLFVYDHKGSVDAFRFTWVLDLYGFHNHQVINGGLVAWKKAGYPTTQDSIHPQPVKHFSIPGNPDHSILATIADLKMAIHDSTTIILDTREDYEYLGLPFIADNQIHSFKKGAWTSGCIPTAIHMNWSEFADLHGDHRIKCEKDLRYNLSIRGVTKEKKVIVYCQSGSRSSHTAFVLRHILGYSDVKNYDGSWIEWSYEYIHNQSVPIEQKSDLSTINNTIAVLKSTLKKDYE